jgi:hypothetical protein
MGSKNKPSKQLLEAGFLIPDKLSERERDVIDDRLSQHDVELLLEIQKKLHQAPADPVVAVIPPRGPKQISL